jgi:hypothetical protein
MLPLATGLPQRLGTVSLDLARRDGPDGADLAACQSASCEGMPKDARLDTKRPCGFDEGHRAHVGRTGKPCWAISTARCASRSMMRALPQRFARALFPACSAVRLASRAAAMASRMVVIGSICISFCGADNMRARVYIVKGVIG